MVREVANNVDEKNNYKATLAPREDDSDPLQPQGTSWTHDVDSKSTVNCRPQKFTCVGFTKTSAAAKPSRLSEMIPMIGKDSQSVRK